jgi:uncharacterized phiE125 gp8 family phage protein
MTTKLVSVETEPVTLTEAKLRLRIDGTDDDDDLTMLISAARSMCEQQIDGSVSACTWDLKIDKFPDGEIKLMWPPVAAITSVTYVDTNGDAQVMDSSAYSLDSHSEPAWLLPAVDTEWPETYDTANAVTVRYTAGYGTSCPQPLKLWILLHVGHWYRNRESATDKAMVATPYANSLLDRYRVW